MADIVINIISCVFTALAFVYALYFWMLDQLNEGETEFIKGKEALINTLKESEGRIKAEGISSLDNQFLEEIQRVNNQLEIVLNYRFWANSTEYKKISDFYLDSKYLISVIKRVNEFYDKQVVTESLISIDNIDDYNEKIIDDYSDGLAYIISYMEEWK